MVGSGFRHSLAEPGAAAKAMGAYVRDGRDSLKNCRQSAWCVAPGLICPQQPVRQLFVVGPGRCEEAVEVSGWAIAPRRNA